MAKRIPKKSSKIFKMRKAYYNRRNLYLLNQTTNSFLYSFCRTAIIRHYPCLKKIKDNEHKVKITIEVL